MGSYQEKFSDGKFTMVGASRHTGLPYHVLVHAVEQGYLPVERRGKRIAIDPEQLARYVASRH